MKSSGEKRGKNRFLLGLMIFLVLFTALALYMKIPPKWPYQPVFVKVPNGKCEVIRDKFDTPHISAPSRELLFYCWGRIVARDRTWQLDFLRRAATGRLAEVYGDSFVKQDFFIRILSFDKVVQRWMKGLKNKPQAYRRLLLFAQGINDEWRELKERPYQWKKLKYTPPPWTVEDTLHIALLQSFHQTKRSFIDDINHALLRLRIGEKNYRAIYGKDRDGTPDDHFIIKPGEHPLVPAKKPVKSPGTQPATSPSKNKKEVEKVPGRSENGGAGDNRLVPPGKREKIRSKDGDNHLPTEPNNRKRGIDSQKEEESVEEKIAALERLRAYLEEVSPFERGEGSNNWVIGSKYLKSARAALANDPHLAITTPSFWHEIHVRAPGIDAMGLSLPGVPAIPSGNNRYIAWGLTNGYSNTADVMLMSTHLKKSVKFGNKSYKIERFSPVVYIKKWNFFIPVFWKKFKRTEIGSFLPIPMKKGKSLLMVWSSYWLKQLPIEAAWELMTARSAEEAEKALQRWELPCWNFVFADLKGNFGYRQVGLIAKRERGIRGLLNLSDEKQHWKGFLSAKEAPHLFNPERGFIVTANNRPFPPGYPYFMGHAYAEGYRARRIEELIKKIGGEKKLGFEELKEIQTDVRVPEADLLLPVLFRYLEGKVRSDRGKKALEMLKRWDRRATVDSVEQTIFRVFVNRLEGAIFSIESVHIYPGPAILKKFLEKGEYPKFEKAVLETKKEPLQKLVPRIFEETLKFLKEKLGEMGPKWKWGQVHKIYFYSILGREYPYRPKAMPKDGDENTVNVSQSSGKFPYWVRNAPSYRLLVLLGPDKIRSIGVLAGKNIDRAPTELGHQQRLWLERKYRPRPFYREEIEKYKKSRFIIKTGGLK